MTIKLLKIFFIVFLTFQLIACSSDENEIIVYRIETTRYDSKENKKDKFVAMEPLKFTIWIDANIVYAEAPLDDLLGMLGLKIGIMNKDCIINDKNNWCCYGVKDTQTDLYEWHLRKPILITKNDWASKEVTALACHYGMKNGKWMNTEKYSNTDSVTSSIQWSCSYLTWLFYKYFIGSENTNEK